MGQLNCTTSFRQWKVPTPAGHTKRALGRRKLRTVLSTRLLRAGSLTLLVMTIAAGLTSGARSPEASAMPASMLPGHFTATGGVIDPNCDGGRGLDVKVPAHVSPETAYGTASATLPDGETVVSIGPFGSSKRLLTDVFAFSAHCTLWKPFGTNGTEALQVPSGGEIELLTPSAKGEILIGAVTAAGKIMLGLMLANGTIDRRFGHAGWSLLPWPGYPTAIDQEPSGRILVGDTDSGGCCGFNWVGAVTEEGAVEHRFGDNGLVVVPRNLEDVEISRVAVEPDGDILAVTSGGHMGIWGTYPTALSPQGVPLPGLQDRFEQALRRLGTSAIFVADLLVRFDGFLVVGTEQGRPVSNLPDPSAIGQLVAFRSDGSLDTKFGDDGRTMFSSPLQELVVAVPVPAGGVLMVGTDPAIEEPSNAPHQVLRIVALSASGRVDERYGVQGRSRVKLPYGPFDSSAVVVSSSRSDIAVVVGSPEGAGFELDEFRL